MPKKNEENQIEKLNEEIDILEGLIEEPDVNSTIIANIEDLNEEIDDKGEELTKEVENNTEIKQNSKIENLKKQIDNLNDEREKNEKANTVF